MRPQDGLTRRKLLAMPAAPALAMAQGDAPWYRRTYRWGQTNLTEIDPSRYNLAFWREYWKRTEVQGVIINAGGIVAYYPSKYPLHRRAEYLNGRDLYGEIAKAAHDDGLFVFARMDSNRAAAEFYRAHPDWFAVNAQGEPYRAGDKYVACINTGYYEQHLPNVLREIIERSHPEGITDNSWAGLGRDSICHCMNCAARFRARSGRELPRRVDWDDPAYREWILWNYARRLEIWDLNNHTTKAAGGPHCLWVGMNSGSISNQARSLRDLKEICARAEMIMLDHQARSEAGGFQQNTDAGKLVHGLLGWDKLIPESMAMYQNGRQSFRLSAKPAAEARMWMIAGFAGGIQPWWHHVGALHEDRRAYQTAEPIMRWHRAHERRLVDRTPLAAVGVVWSQRNTDFYGRDDAEQMVDQPYRGMAQALVRARIPYIPVHAGHIAREGRGLAALVLPDLAALSDAECAAVRQFVRAGGGLLATGAASLFTEMGDRRQDFGLADLFGAHLAGAAPDRKWAASSQHSYLRIAQRHDVLRGFEETDILPFGGMLPQLRVEAAAAVPLTFIPPFPVYPPETAWMRQPKTDIAGLILNGRVAYLAADLDRRYAREHLPDHADLLANLVRWAARDRVPLKVEGSGYIDCSLYRQPAALVLHVVNLTSAGTWRAPMDEPIAVGPLQVKVQLPRGLKPAEVRLLVAGQTRPASIEQGWAVFELRSVLDHEVAVLA